MHIRVEMELRFGHSLLDAVKVPIWFLLQHQQYDPRPLTASTPGVPLIARMDLWARAVELVSVIALGWIVWRFRRMPLLNGIFALSIAETLLPYNAPEYTLLVLYIPFALLLVTLARGASAGTLALNRGYILRLLLPCAALFTPLNFMSIFTGFTKTLLLLYLLVQICRIPIRSPLFDEMLPTTESQEPRLATPTVEDLSVTS